MKKNVYFNVFILIITILVIVTGGYLTLNKNNNKGQEKIDDDTKSPLIKDFDILKAEEILEYFGFNVNFGCGSLVYDSFYSDSYKKITAIEKVEQSKIKNMKCSELYSELDLYGNYKGENGVCPQTKSTSVISYEDVNEIYKKMYGKSIEKEGFSSTRSMLYKFYDYNESLDSFVKLECGACGGACPPALNIIINKIKSAKLVDNNLIIQIYHLNSSPYYNEYSKKYIYRLETRKIQVGIDADNEKSFKDEVINKYLDKLDVYEITFKQKDNQYIFASLNEILSD